MGNYATGQACLNGHPIVGDYENSRGLSADFCPQCGERTITKCPNCNANIRGDYLTEGYFMAGWEPSSYCHACGKPFPWTERAIAAAQELAEEANALDDGEKAKLKGSIADLVAGGPKADVAGVRFRALAAKAGPVVGKAIRDVIVSVLSEAAKKAAGL